jgi:hypothetical protein
MLFGFNRLVLINEKLNFVYAFSPFEALKYCKFKVQERRIIDKLLQNNENDDAPIGSDDSTH